MSEKEQPQKHRWAGLLFSILPSEQRNALDDHLTNHEWEKLATNRPTSIPSKLDNAFLQATKAALNERSVAEKKGFAGLFFGLQLALSIFALLHRQLELAGAFATYGGVGYLIFRKESLSYWRNRFTRMPMHWSFLVLSGLSYIAIFLAVGSLSLEVPSRRLPWLLLSQAVLFGPVFEEMLFRDFLFRLCIGKGHGGFHTMAVAISATTFAMVHLSWQRDTFAHEMLAYLLAGVLLGSLRWLTRSLSFPLLVHSAVNATILWL